jgi:hypothetical protein
MLSIRGFAVTLATADSLLYADLNVQVKTAEPISAEITT